MDLNESVADPLPGIYPVEQITKQRPLNPDYFYHTFHTKIFFFIIGIFGNVLCLLIWTKPDFLKMSRSSTCIVLTLADLTYLIQMLVSAVIKNFTGKIILLIIR